MIGKIICDLASNNLNNRNSEEEREKQRKILQNAHEEIRRVGQTRYDKIYKILNLGANIILVILNICLLITVFADVDAIKGVGAWIVLIVGVVGDIDFLSFQKSRVKN